MQELRPFLVFYTRAQFLNSVFESNVHTHTLRMKSSRKITSVEKIPVSHQQKTICAIGDHKSTVPYSRPTEVFHKAPFWDKSKIPAANFLDPKIKFKTHIQTIKNKIAKSIFALRQIKNMPTK